MYLHNDKESFKEMIDQVATKNNIAPEIVEKDYYVTLILRLLSEKLDNIVFKGGTSLSKGFHVINRFSEDIDVTFNEHIGESRRKKLKYNVLKVISEELSLPISNWSSIQSDRDYNAYFFEYHSVFDFDEDKMPQYVKLETALGSYSFPTEVVEIKNYIGDYLDEHDKNEYSKQFMLDRFSMKLQSLERTYIDKVFALCDYYIEGKSKRYSRHLYDVYMLTPLMNFDDNFKLLIEEIRLHRKNMPNCPSAQDGVSVNNLIKEFCENKFYKEDYLSITNYFTSHPVEYKLVIENILELTNKNIFN